MAGERTIIGQRDEVICRRTAGSRTFALPPCAEEAEHAGIAMVGIPFDGSTNFGPAVRFRTRPCAPAFGIVRRINGSPAVIEPVGSLTTA